MLGRDWWYAVAQDRDYWHSVTNAYVMFYRLNYPTSCADGPSAPTVCIVANYSGWINERYYARKRRAGIVVDPLDFVPAPSLKRRTLATKKMRDMFANGIAFAKFTPELFRKRNAIDHDKAKVGDRVDSLLGTLMGL